MPRTRKPEYYALAKSAGLPLAKKYIQYTNDELLDLLKDAGIQIPEPMPEEPKAKKPRKQAPPTDGTSYVATPEATPVYTQGPADPNELPGQRLNTQPEDEPIRIDDQGRLWYQEEVLKPAYPKPRGRRVLTYIERGVKKLTVQNGEYLETFEIAGEGTPRPAEVKITLPSYQVGIYKDPRFPFRIHCYNGREGFALFEVQQFFGGSELVPESCKRIYIENDLCYDVRSVIRTIQNEHRQLQLVGRVK